MAGVKGMKWGARKQAPKKMRKPNIPQRLTAMGADVRLYAIWSAMNSRCYNSKCPAYKDYGGRGITVCDRWRRSPDNPDAVFNFAADMGNPPPDRSLDRKNNDGNYEPTNCRWATAVEQSRNQRPRDCTPAWVLRDRTRKILGPTLTSVT